MKISKDANHYSIRKHLQAIGARVIDSANYGMSVDLIAWYRGNWFMIEIKTKSAIKKGRWEAMTSKGKKMDEQKFAREIHPAPYYVVSDKDEAQGVLMNSPGFRDRCRVDPYDKDRMRKEFREKYLN